MWIILTRNHFIYVYWVAITCCCTYIELSGDCCLQVYWMVMELLYVLYWINKELLYVGILNCHGIVVCRCIELSRNWCMFMYCIVKELLYVRVLNVLGIVICTCIELSRNRCIYVYWIAKQVLCVRIEFARPKILKISKAHMSSTFDKTSWLKRKMLKHKTFLYFALTSA